MTEDENSSSVIPEWDWKKFILFLNASTAEKMQDFLLRRLNHHSSMMHLDEFTAQFVILYEAVRPKLLKDSHSHGDKKPKWTTEGTNALTLKELISFSDELTTSGNRPDPNKLIKAFRRLSMFLEIWGVTQVEYRKKDPGAEVET